MSYARLVRIPGVVPVLLSVFVGALPIGILTLALLLFAKQRTGSIGVAGVVVAAFGIGNAVGLLVQGRLLDRFPPRWTIGVAGPLCAVVLVASSMSAPPHVSVPLYVALVGVGGLALPAVTTFARSGLPELFATADERAAAYALLSVVFQAALAIGPLLVSGTLLVASPMTAILEAAGIVLVATGLVMLAAVGHQVRRPRWQRSVNSRLRASPGLVTVVIIAMGVGLVAGLTIVAVPAAAIARDQSAISGLAFGALATGGLCGGLVVGWRLCAAHFRAFLLETSLLLTAGACALEASATLRPLLLVPVLFLGGVVAAPISIVLSTQLDHVVDRAHLAQAFATLVSSGLVASAVGSAVGGSAIHALGPGGLLLCAGGVLVVIVAWAAGRRSTIVGLPM